jgi:prenyltransferase beta subunit
MLDENMTESARAYVATQQCLTVDGGAAAAQSARCRGGLWFCCFGSFNMYSRQLISELLAPLLQLL